VSVIEGPENLLMGKSSPVFSLTVMTSVPPVIT
jgi:hypothetical protein